MIICAVIDRRGVHRLRGLAQRDMKKPHRYPSIAHMGFCHLGQFLGFQLVAPHGRTAIELGGMGRGADASHGLVSGAMFRCGA